MSKIKCKERILKGAKEKQLVMYKRTPIRQQADFSAETLQAKREWQSIFNVMKGKKKCNHEYFTQEDYYSDFKRS